MGSVNIYDAKTQFSKLVKRVRAGEEIIIADAGRPVAKLVPFESPKQRRVLGIDDGKVWIADDAFAPMTSDELSEWYESPIFPVDAGTPKPRRQAKPAKPARKAKAKPRMKR